jgi:AraC-like DNA-binding protein
MSQGLTLFLLLGIAQGLFLALLLATRRENAAANRVLAGAMVAFAVFLAEVVLYASDHFRSVPFLIGISQPVIYLFGPAIYLYARTVSGGPERPGRHALLHLLPAAAVFLYLLPFYLKSGADKIAFVEALMRNGAPFDVQIIQWLKLPHGAAYTLVTFGVLARYRRRLEENFSTLDRINLSWLRHVLIGVMLTWAVAIVHFGLGLAGVQILDADLSPASLVLVVIVYMIGILGLRQPDVFWPQESVDFKEKSPKEVSLLTSAKYRKSGLDPAKAVSLEKALLALMEEHKPHEDSGLTLQNLSDRLGVSLHNLSEVINARLGMSFHDFVNGYRVEDAKRHLLDPKLAHQTILAVALDSGFRSKSTFNKIFKRFTGATPSEFRRENAPG